MDQMEARGHFYKCLKENSQSKPAVNLSIYLEGREGRNPCCTSAGSHIVGRGFGKKTTESQSTGRKKKTYLAFCQYFKGDRKNELYLLE